MMLMFGVKRGWNKREEGYRYICVGRRGGRERDEEYRYICVGRRGGRKREEGL